MKIYTEDKVNVLVTYEHSDRAPHTGCCKLTKMYLLSLTTRGLKSRAVLPPKALGDSPVLASSGFCGSRHSLVCGLIHLPS